jgi:isoquinoline 1-oxidoreductase alpha subunit
VRGCRLRERFRALLDTPAQQAKHGSNAGARMFPPRPLQRSEGVEMTSFKLNGKQTTVEADADTPLLWVIRDEAGLTGTKFGCGIGMCGACTVHIGGKAKRSCVTPLSAVEGAEVTTIEGLDPKGQHPVQKAWQDLQVPQCGYCQSGQIMQAASVLKDNPNITDADIDTQMSGNLCRCMTYPRIRAAVRQAANAMKGA